ncbi:MAG TPA: ribonuclease H-like domain-containing protein [bacterium]
MVLIHRLRQFEADSRRPRTVRSNPIEGVEAANPLGRFFKSEREHRRDHAHGRIILQHLFDIPAAVFEAVGKDAALGGLDAGKTVFLDTETTGLAGGTGTVPFLVGLGYFTESGFRIEQFFMRDFDEEPAMLFSLREALGRFRFIVSYNGKAFDLNLLAARFTLARMHNPLERLPHLDLLHTARRLWRRRLGDCSLASIERGILGFVRQDDVPGFVIPHLYFEYLRTGNAGSLDAVFRHNQWDILALAALTGLTGRIFDKPHEHLDHALDFLSLGRVMENRFRLEEAAACFLRALDHPLEPEEREEVLTRLGLVWKRLGLWEKAVPIWEYGVRHLPFSPAPYEELAKYYEHGLRDFVKALEWTERALERLAMLVELKPDPSLEGDRRELQIRLKRLKRKLQVETSEK